MLIPVTDPLPSGKRCGVHSERTTANRNTVYESIHPYCWTLIIQAAHQKNSLGRPQWQKLGEQLPFPF